MRLVTHFHQDMTHRWFATRLAKRLGLGLVDVREKIVSEGMAEQRRNSLVVFLWQNYPVFTHQMIPRQFQQACGLVSSAT